MVAEPAEVTDNIVLENIINFVAIYFNSICWNRYLHRIHVNYYDFLEIVNLCANSLRVVDISGTNVVAVDSSPANELPEAVFGLPSLTSIILPSTLTSIGNAAVYVQV